MVRYPDSHQPKVLILYASYGEGHLQAAKAIRDALEEQGNNRTVMVDLMAESHPWLNEMTRRVYLKSYTHIPHLYGWVYDVTRPMKHNSLFGGFLHSFGRDKIRKLLQKEKPDAVIHTFPFFALPDLHRRRPKKTVLPQASIPTYTVITDFDLHRRWVHPGIGRYFVATEDMKQELGSLGIHPGRVSVSGIPLARGFRSSLTPSFELYEKYGLSPEQPVILLMPGAQGVMPDCDELCRHLLEQHPNAQIALICGRNNVLKSSMADQFKHHAAADRLHLYGYVNQVHELMALSTCLVSKPGGVTLAEAICAGLPLFLYKPVPGQEKNNARYLQSKGAASIANDPEEMAAAIIKLVNDPEQLKLSEAAVQRLQTEGAAADNIAHHILLECGWNAKFGQRYS
ncbi:processive 1,2-diacylglycerol beta-glucosyltransferase [Paenibacillus catalpae]|uniref:Processive 1,2-diacylglycerol beta-glucosyltransferase n=1 Tax=Paenibacillus catalpae TaxID=1045775 RepID=A0A1I2DR52_9BACL|nr:diglucosyl diacylglycerol synthase [Paenibacillus catalpae]SFE82783.1 processive 1,2-diacylglycerol beta-glucosyltransferase [Paenibacillus catalpae]